MKPEEHNRFLAYAHFGFGAFQLFMTLMMVVISFLIFGALAEGDTRGEMPFALIMTILIVTFFFQLLFTVPSIVAGFGLLKRKRWAKTASIIAAVLDSMSFPLGLAVCIYTVWFMFGAEGKEFYARQFAEAQGRPVSFLHEPSATDTTDRWTERGREYVPPGKMPDWR